MAARSRRHRRHTMVTGVAVLALLAGAVVFALNAGSGLPIGRFTTVRAAFTDVGPLLVGDEVRVNSQRAGRVDRIELDGEAAVVTMTLDGGRDVYRDATASLQARSALGQKFVDLDPGRAASGELGDEVLDVRKTRAGTELDAVLDVFDPPTRDGLQRSVRELGTGTAGHGRDLNDFLAGAPDLLGDTATTSRALSSEAADLPGLLASGERLSGRFTGREREISALVTDLDRTVQAVAVDSGGPLGDTVDRLPDTLDRARTAFVALNPPLGSTESALGRLRPGAESLGAATPDLRGVLTESVVPLGKVPGVADQAVPAVEDLTHTVADLRPLAPEVATALQRLRTPLETLAPYREDISLFFSDSRSALAQGDGDKKWLRLGIVAKTDAVTGIVPGLQDPTVSRDPYPAPGQVRQQREDGIVGERR